MHVYMSFGAQDTLWALSKYPVSACLGWPRLALALVPCDGPTFWQGYHLTATDQAFIGVFE